MKTVLHSSAELLYLQEGPNTELALTQDGDVVGLSTLRLVSFPITFISISLTASSQPDFLALVRSHTAQTWIDIPKCLSYLHIYISTVLGINYELSQVTYSGHLDVHVPCALGGKWGCCWLTLRCLQVVSSIV